jgi:hypothetical protein
MADWSVAKLFDGDLTTYLLKAEKITRAWTRAPLATQIPKYETSPEPELFAIDLGMCNRVIGVTGFIGPDNEYDDALMGYFPSAADLETAVEEWWKSANWDEGTGLVEFTTWLGEVYKVLFKTLNLELPSGQEFYNFNLELLVYSRVSP